MKNDVRRTLVLCLTSSLLFAACGGSLPYPGLTADEVYALGLEAREQEDWGDAAEAFEYILFSPGFTHAAEARLLLADAKYSDGQYIESRSEYQRVVDRWPADTVAVRAALGICRSLASLSPITQRDQAFTRQARLACRQVSGDFAGTVMGLEAARLADEMILKLAERDYGTGQHYLKRGLLDSALLYFEEVASAYPDTEWAPWALYRMIEVFGRIGYLRDVETTRDLLLDAYADSEPAQLLLEDGGA
jgi:outer membrane protein assembly factor BamD